MAKQRKQTWQEQAFSLWTVLFDMTEGSLYISLRLEMKECMRCGGFLLVFTNTWWLLFSELCWVALKEWDHFTGQGPRIFWRRCHGTATELFSVFVQGSGCTLLFSYSLHKRMNFEVDSTWCPLSLPSLLHSPYLLLSFARQPSCSSLMREHLQLLGWREGDKVLR